MNTTKALALLKNLQANIASSTTVDQEDGECINACLDEIVSTLGTDNAPSIDKPKLVVQEDELASKVLACPECGGREFQYVESYLTWRSTHTNEDCLIFDGSFDWESGDDTPGVCCANSSCKTELDATGVEVDFL